MPVLDQKIISGPPEGLILTGKPYPLGATFDGNGTNFSVFSEVAQRVQLCLFDDEGVETQFDLPEQTNFCWHGYLPGVLAGQKYGFRVHGPWDIKTGRKCCPAKLLLDPYAKSVEGQLTWNQAVFAFNPQNPEGPPNMEDSAPYVPRSVVVNPFFDWSKDRPPATSIHETIIYEAHIKGLTMLHPDLPPEIRGTYAGLAHPAIIEYLRNLGITAIELMPVQYFLHEGFLLERGLRNYWGYHTLSFFAPHNEYTYNKQAAQGVQEFKFMVRELHAAGIEVIMDVVYNHTGEGNHLGPVLCYKGLDNAAYYRLVPHQEKYYMDYTGTGNSLNMRHPQVLQMVMDSLRYWVTEMHVDGFRFDLAATLAREIRDVDRLSAFFDIIHQDPVLSQVKLIAEPWDIGPDGYQIGKFPPQWSEWNGLYRDQVRDYWRGWNTRLGDFAHRFCGSSDLYRGTGRRPHASVNFICSHDGLTLSDLVSYDHKHNEANQEGNRDGTDDNRSWNCGAEGPTDEPGTNALRARQKRNFLATLFLSQGIPMLLHGDEVGRTQGGNNNTFCQDNEISWLDWEHLDPELFDFVVRLIKIRKAHPIFRRWKWFEGREVWGIKDINWFQPSGAEMTQQDWTNGFAKSLTVFLSGQLGFLDSRGQPVIDNGFFLLFNSWWEGLDFHLPERAGERVWVPLLDTRSAYLPEEVPIYHAGDNIHVEGRSMILLIGVAPEDEDQLESETEYELVDNVPIKREA